MPLRRPSSQARADINLTKVIFGAHYQIRSFQNFYVKSLLFNKYTILFLFLSKDSNSWGEGWVPPPAFRPDSANLSPDAN